MRGGRERRERGGEVTRLETLKKRTCFKKTQLDVLLIF